MAQILETLFKSADSHAEDTGEQEHAIGDLQDLLRETWKTLMPSQKLNIIRSPVVAGVLEAGALTGASPNSLEREFNAEMIAKEIETSKAGYKFFEEENGHYWETDDETGETVPTIIDAIDCAHKHLLQSRKPKMKP